MSNINIMSINYLTSDGLSNQWKDESSWCFYNVAQEQKRTLICPLWCWNQGWWTGIAGFDDGRKYVIRVAYFLQNFYFTGF
jgi:hypothetical protein